MPETAEEREARKRREAEERRAKETPEERAARKAREAERAKETPEEREARKRREAEERRAKETPEERAARKAREAAAAGAPPPAPAAPASAAPREETPEEREARKRREAEERRAKETPEQRAARKAREAERAKEKEQAQAGGGGGARRSNETPEEREERKRREAEATAARAAARDDRPVVHKQAIANSPAHPSSRKDSEAAAAAKPAEKVIQAAPPPSSRAAAAAAAQDDDDGYEDDFEEVLDADKLQDAIRATEAENARLRAAAMMQQQASASGGKSGSAAYVSGSDSQQQQQPQFKGETRAGFNADALARGSHKAQYERDMARAVGLRRLVDLDEARFTIVDIAPQSKYEVFLRQMTSQTTTVKNAETGKESVVATGPIANAAVQAPEQRIDVEIQAERVSRKTRAVQAPNDMGLFPEGQQSVAAANKDNKADQQTTDNNKGGDDTSSKDAADGSNKQSGTAKSTKPRLTAFDKRRVDTAALGAFMTSVFPVFRALLDDNDQRHGGAESALSPNTQKAAAKHSFTQGAPAVLKHAISAGRPVVATAYSQLTPQYMLVAHGPVDAQAAAGDAAASSDKDWKRASAYDGLAALWNSNDPQRPDKVLVAPGPLADVCLSPTKPYIAYGALRHGAVCVWDLREPESAHGGSAMTIGLRAPSFISGWSGDLHEAPVRRILVSGYNSATGPRGGDGAAGGDETEQVVTLDEAGGISHWMLTADDGSSKAVGLTHTQSSIHHHHGGSGGELMRSGSFTSPGRQRQRQQAAASAAADNDLGAGLGSSVHLYRASQLNALDDTRAKNAARKAADDGTYGDYGSHDANAGGGMYGDPTSPDSTSAAGGASSSGRAVAITLDMDLAPSDASHLLVAGSGGVRHISKFGSITAPSVYGAGGDLGGCGSSVLALLSSSAPATSVACSPMDSRLLLVGYANGAVRLFLRDEAQPAYSAHVSTSAIVSVRWAANRRWVAFTLDADGAAAVLDLAAANKAKPVAVGNAAQPTGQYTAMAVSYEERDTHLALGGKDGVVEVHTIAFDKVLPLPVQRDERWL